MDRKRDIAVGYSFGGALNYPGQHLAARLAEGAASQTNTLRWEDYSQTAIDPSDDCTIWYVGDYLKKDAASYSTRIGAFRLPGC